MSNLILKRNAGLIILGVALFVNPVFAEEEASDPAEIVIGERLFLETRFARFFFVHGQGGDPVMDTTETINGALPGPFAGQSMNCAACHLVDQQLGTPDGGMRTYGDFARRSPIPQRAEDDKTHAPRNSPPLVNASLPRRGGPLFHFDGEFATLHDLVKDTYTGRNYGWLPGEHGQAVRHFAAVIRNDDGSGELAQEFGGAYRVVLKGTDRSIPGELRLPEEFRIDVDTASDEELFEQVTRITVAYVEDLQFSRDDDGAFNLSPYDLFLEKNGLPRQPRKNETDKQYSQRLLRKVRRLKHAQYVAPEDGKFAFHNQAFEFGPTELEGMKLFFTRSSNAHGLGKRSQHRAGNCVACHAAPNFTDFSLHNTGITEFEYDGIHGEGAFEALYIPALDVRNSNPLAWLPATGAHPDALEPLRAIPSAERPGETDLGAWNIFANPDFPNPQKKLRRLLCHEQRQALLQIPRAGWRDRHHCSKPALLERSIASFKTPGLRDLGHSAPYMHNGQLDTLEAVVDFYVNVSEQAREGRLRNPAPALHGIRLSAEDVEPIAAFLRALNEDYE
jgi:cytochrome c peroxidase